MHFLSFFLHTHDIVWPWDEDVYNIIWVISYWSLFGRMDMSLPKHATGINEQDLAIIIFNKAHKIPGPQNRCLLISVLFAR